MMLTKPFVWYLIQRLIDKYNMPADLATEIVTNSTFSRLLENDPHTVMSQSMQYWLQDVVHEAEKNNLIKLCRRKNYSV